MLSCLTLVLCIAGGQFFNRCVQCIAHGMCLIQCMKCILFRVICPLEREKNWLPTHPQVNTRPKLHSGRGYTLGRVWSNWKVGFGLHLCVRVLELGLFFNWVRNVKPAKPKIEKRLKLNQTLSYQVGCELGWRVRSVSPMEFIKIIKVRRRRDYLIFHLMKNQERVSTVNNPLFLSVVIIIVMFLIRIIWSCDVL